jgi:hypothetical protein
MIFTVSEYGLILLDFFILKHNNVNEFASLSRAYKGEGSVSIGDKERIDKGH